MGAVTALLLIFIISVNAVDIFMTYRESNQKLDAVSGDMIRFENPGEKKSEDDLPELPGDFEGFLEGFNRNDGESDKDGKRNPPKLPERAPLFGISRDDAEGARFFKVYFDSDGNIISVNIDRISSVTEEEAKSCALAVINGKTETGRTGGFMYRINQNYRQGKSVTFMDISSEKNHIISVALVSVCAGILCWLIMFIITSRVSTRAIKPIAENIEKQKRFVSDAGHEIKTPLAVIKANTEAMELYNGENKWSKNIKSQVDRLNGLMQELLQLSKSDEGINESSLETVSLSDLSRKMTGAFTELAVTNGKSIVCDIEDGITIRSNVKLLERIIDILLDNAVKYSSEDSEIKYSLLKEKKHCEIRVENRCDKLPECEPEKLFDRFYRDDSSRNSEGFGIGLASALASAQALGGSLNAEYKENNTIEFIFKL